MSLCFILTAGLGTRMRPFSGKLPKPCLPFINLPLMNYGFYLAKQAGFDHFLFNTHHLPEKLDLYTGKLRDRCSSIRLSREFQLLGSGGALWKARRELEKEEFFLVANGDSLLIAQDNQVLSRLVDQFQEDQSLCTLLTCDHPELLKSLGPVWADKNRNVLGFGYKPPKMDSTILSSESSMKKTGFLSRSDCGHLKPLHYTGYKVFSRRIFDFLPQGPSSIFSDVLAGAIASGERVSCFHLSKAFWYETGDFGSFLKASEEVSQKHWSWLEGIHRFFNQSLCKSEKNQKDILVLFKDEKHKTPPLFRGFNVMGRRVRFSPEVVLENTIVADDCQLSNNRNYTNQFVLH